MATAQISATSRTTAGKGAARALRREGNIPAIIYGHARQPQSLAVSARDLQRLLDSISAESTVIELDVDGTTSRTLIKEIQRHPFKRHVLHVDFQELVAGEKVTVFVPIVITGTADGVRNSGGVLNQVMTELEIHVDPANIPTHVELDVTDMAIGTSRHVSALVVPDGVEVLADAEETVVVISAPRVVTEDAPAAAEEGEATGEPELIRKPKAEEDDEE
jgi:large subunit ribosomal protein L25